jgi:hypothetical protein
MGLKARALLQSPGCTARRENCVKYVHPLEKSTNLGHKHVISERKSSRTMNTLYNYHGFEEFFFRRMKVYLYLAEDTSGVHPACLVHCIAPDIEHRLRGSDNTAHCSQPRRINKYKNI